MSLSFSELPGAWERHLIRKVNNPLFGASVISQQDVAKAQQQDALELAHFMDHFQQLIEQTANLQPNADADVVLKLKEQMDRTYEQCAGLAGDQSQSKDMLQKLLQIIMQAMWKGVGQDMQAHSKLKMETEAREAHFALLEHSLVADLLRPQSPIEEHELVPTLLSESAEALAIAMQLFSAEQQMVLYQKAKQLIEETASDHPKVTEAHQRLVDMQSLLQAWNQMPS